MNQNKKVKKLLIKAIKIAIGSSIAIYIAELLQLEFAASAGSITLLTLLTTKWETLKLSLFRLITFVLSVGLAWIGFNHFQSEWVAYGIFIFLIVVISEALGWQATVSVNAVIGTHFLTAKEFGYQFILNEFLIVLIGITIAIVLNLFNDNHNQKKTILINMNYTENQLQMVLEELANYLLNKEMQQNVWDDICKLEQQLEGFIGDAYEYQNNTFYSHTRYYIEYFEMRMKQCNVLHNLHYEVKKIRQMPKQANVIAQYMLYMKDYVIEKNSPEMQIEKLHQIFLDMKTQPLPVSREEFESRAVLYHILMDLEEFLIFKKRFVNNLDVIQLKRYWENQSA